MHFKTFFDPKATFRNDVDPDLAFLMDACKHTGTFFFIVPYKWQYITIFIAKGERCARLVLPLNPNRVIALLKKLNLEPMKSRYRTYFSRNTFFFFKVHLTELAIRQPKVFIFSP